jgi:hypothetical protein
MNRESPPVSITSLLALAASQSFMNVLIAASQSLLRTPRRGSGLVEIGLG